MNMLEEQKRLMNLIGTEFVEVENGTIWRVTAISHNIYKDVVLIMYDEHANKKELIEGSEDYYKKFMRREDVCDYRY